MYLFRRQSEHKPKHQTTITILNVLLAMATVGAVATFVLWYGGFELSQAHRVWLHRIQTAVVLIFVLDRLARMSAARQWRQYLRKNIVDFALIAVMLVAVAAGYAFRDRIRGSVFSFAALYVVITQAFILLLLLVRVVDLNVRLTGSGIPPAWLLMTSFAALALVGSGLLMLPVATPPDSQISYGDALFTSVSATCVTGLVVRDTGADFTPFGQAVILAMIQLGGLGIMLFGTAMAMAVGKGLSFRSRSAVGEMLSLDTVGQVHRTMGFVVLTTLALEAAGAAMMFPMFARSGGPAVSTGQTAWYSVFHSVSGFCNAGFSLFTDNLMHGVGAGEAEALRDRWQVMGVLAPLILLGGLGFPVLRDCARWVRRALHRAREGISPKLKLDADTKAGPVMGLHSKVVLVTSAVLLIAGAVGMLLAGSTVSPQQDPAVMTATGPEGETDWQGLSAWQRLRAAVFQSVTARTAGFNTVDIAQIGPSGKLTLCGLMIVGGSPASTAGGMKTVTAAILVLTAVSALRRRGEVEAFRRSISPDLLRRAVAIGVLYLGLVAVVTMLLTMSMGNRDSFIDLLFEACSACGTVGLSAGVTTHLTAAAKAVIVGAMFTGRLGPLTLLLAMTSHVRRIDYRYPTENVLIG